MNDSSRFSLRGRAERAFCVPCASPGRRDLGNMSTPPHPSKPPLFFPEPTTLRPTLCADKNAPFHPRRPQRIYHPPGTASPSCRSSPLLPNEISSRDSVPVPANLFHRIENPPVSVFALPSLEPQSSYLRAKPSSCFRQATVGRQSEARLR